jgi:multidrug efflux pump subunit AcrA (membrane-fusion protein)
MGSAAKDMWTGLKMWVRIHSQCSWEYNFFGSLRDSYFNWRNFKMSSDAFAKITRGKAIISVIFLLIIIAAALFLISQAKHQAAVSREQDSLTATGTVEAKKVMASFKVPGKIANLLVDEGSKVEQGQDLASLDSRELTSKLTQARGAFEAASAQARQASGSVPLTSQQVETTIEQTRAKVAQAEVGVTDAEQQLVRAHRRCMTAELFPIKVLMTLKTTLTWLKTS